MRLVQNNLHLLKAVFRRQHSTTSVLPQVACKRRPELDFDYLLNKQNYAEITENLKMRKQVGDLDLVLEKWNQIQHILGLNEETPDIAVKKYDLKLLWDDFYDAASLVPNQTCHSTPVGDESACKVLLYHGEKPDLSAIKKVRLAEDILLSQGTLRTDITVECGEKSYAFIDRAAILEQCLIDFTSDFLESLDFKCVVIPDILDIDTFRECGMVTTKDARRSVYTLQHEPNYGLSGTGEMGLSSLLEDQLYTLDKLPLKFFTLSRCYRPEISAAGQEKLLYRVHEFSKVEMFAATSNKTGRESEEMLAHFVDVQQHLFSSLNLHYRLLEMSSQELGASAYHKFDIEAWMPGRQVYGEISSASNCTDFQSRRLLAKYVDREGRERFLHTVNGTACAATRLMIAFLEQHQSQNQRIHIPECLKPYLDRFPIDKRPKIKLRSAPK